MIIVTGSTGSAHVTSGQAGEFNQGIFGDGLVVLGNGNQLAASYTSATSVVIKDGDLVMQGRHALISPNTTETLSIEQGTVGKTRNDLIVAHYEMDGSGHESITLNVIKGTEGSTATDPTYTTGDIRSGDSVAELPLYRVVIDTNAAITKIQKVATWAGYITDRIDSADAAIKSEASARASAITSEASARASAVSSEASTRASADKTLQTNIDKKADISHASADTTYGVGTTTKYGHAKTINNLTAEKYVSGESLSAYQGAVLNSTKLGKAWTHLVSDLSDSATVTVASMSGFAEICIIFGYGPQMQDIKTLPMDMFKTSGRNVRMQAVEAGKYCWVAYSNATTIGVSEHPGDNWRINIYGR